MYQKPTSKYSSKGRTYHLLEKRNKQFSELFAKVRDPRRIVKAYLKLNELIIHDFPNMRYPNRYLHILIWANERNFFFFSDMMKWYTYTPESALERLMELKRRGLLQVKKGGKPYMYYVSTDGKILLNKFTKAVATILADTFKPETKKRLLKK